MRSPRRLLAAKDTNLGNLAYEIAVFANHTGRCSPRSLSTN
ncbi:hypothetical protein [Micromonospora fulviviridis]|uniref:Uncharacterized protein n=1 Tax=Micromonospora fulviviridis TaxID=47860 RepID=A0ABV2VW43_9ACTN